MLAPTHIEASFRRRFRQRQRIGILPTPVDVPPEVVGRLVEIGELSPVDSEDKIRRGAAISRLLGEWAAKK
jgi:hypothetical protein